jgi:myosin heavy subunit
VFYTINGFIDKNKDLLFPDLEDLMKGSHDPFISNLFADAKFEKGILFHTSLTTRNWNCRNCKNQIYNEKYKRRRSI